MLLFMNVFIDITLAVHINLGRTDFFKLLIGSSHSGPQYVSSLILAILHGLQESIIAFI